MRPRPDLGASAVKVLDCSRLADAFDEMAEFMEEDGDPSSMSLADSGEDFQIWLSEAHVRIPGRGMSVHEYIYYSGGDGAEFIPDFSGWVFLDSITREVLYDEGYSTFYAAICNYLGEQAVEEACEVWV